MTARGNLRPGSGAPNGSVGRRRGRRGPLRCSVRHDFGRRVPPRRDAGSLGGGRLVVRWRRVAAAVSGWLRAWSQPVWDELAPLLGPLGRRWAALPRGWRALLFPLGVAVLWRLAAEQGLAGADDSRGYGEIILVAGLQTMPLLLSSHRPLIALAPVLLGRAIAAGTWSVFPIAGFVALGIALYAVGVRHDRKVAIVTGVLAVAAVLPSAGNSYSGLGLVVPPLVAGISATSLVVADNVRSRR